MKPKVLRLPEIKKLIGTNTKVKFHPDFFDDILIMDNKGEMEKEFYIIDVEKYNNNHFITNKNEFIVYFSEDKKADKLNAESMWIEASGYYTFGNDKAPIFCLAIQPLVDDGFCHCGEKIKKHIYISRFLEYDYCITCKREIK